MCFEEQNKRANFFPANFSVYGNQKNKLVFAR